MADITLFPQPRQLERGEDRFTLDRDTRIVAPERDLGELLAGYLRGATGYALPVHVGADSSDALENAIVLRTSGDAAEAGAYRFQATERLVEISAGARAGFVHGMQTLRQLLPREILGGDLRRDVEWSLPGLTIDDAPAFGWRGLHLDVARHLFSVAEVKRFLDLLAFYKFNVLHWHLTDDQGWRIEIKKYPRLTEIGAWRDETVLPHAQDQFDGQRYGGYFRQAEIRELVAYAGARGITIVPEIELPGHSLAALSAYPELGCAGQDYQVATKWGIEPNIYCAGKDAVFAFLKDVLDETLSLFPAQFIHIGGDEAPKQRWKACPDCQARIKAENLADEDELQSWFVRQFDSWLSERGRRLIGWDEILEGGLAPKAAVMSWRGSQGGIAAASAGHDVVMTPNTYCYLDYYQSEDRESEPPAINAYLPLHQVYQFVVIPEEIPAPQRHHILGGQGNLWTEYIPSFAHLQYMAFPRAIALADILWHHPERRDYQGFLARLRRHLPSLDEMQVNYRGLDE